LPHTTFVSQTMSTKLLPGTLFPSVALPLSGGEETNLSSSGSQKLVVVYRGQFCPFCQGITYFT
jgi:hypothetical protein